MKLERLGGVVLRGFEALVEQAPPGVEERHQRRADREEERLERKERERKNDNSKA
jgi:hypothetical protein